MKKVFTALALAAGLIASACWFGDSYTGSLDDNYIAGLSGDVVHVEENDGSYTITNGQTVAMPFTVFIKVAPHKKPKSYQESDVQNGGLKITKAILQYKVIKENEKSSWVTVKTIDNPDWDLDFDEPVALFGRDTINIPGVTEETTILIRLYLTDGTYETGALVSDIDPDSVVNVITGERVAHWQYEDVVGFHYDRVDSGTATDIKTNPAEWTAPFVMKVKVLPNAGSKPVKRPHR